jgi:hypothetical protein
MKPMPNVWLDSLLTFDTTLTQIENCLNVLKENAEDANFLDINTKKQYSNDVVFMKQFFERAESLVRDSEQ